MATPSILSLTAFTFSLTGLILTIYSTVAPFWTKDDPSEKVNKNEVIVEGLWLKCTIQVLKEKRSCEYYNEFILDSAWELLSARVQGGFLITLVFFHIFHHFASGQKIWSVRVILDHFLDIFTKPPCILHFMYNNFNGFHDLFSARSRSEAYLTATPATLATLGNPAKMVKTLKF